jgi:hypothetical protein
LIHLPFEFQSGNTLLADLDAEHYITDKKRVVSKMTAHNQWVKPVTRIAPTEHLSLSNEDYRRATATFKAFQEWAGERIAKHLPGRHDQSTHAGKKSYQSFDDIANDGDSIQEAVDELYDSSIGRSANGNLPMRVLLERMGKGGKPEIVASIDDLDGEPIYRGTGEENDNGFRNNDYDRIGRGAMGDGYYFSDQSSTADSYAGQFDDGKVMTAGWKKDAKVYDFSVSGRVTEDNYLDNIMEMGGETSQRVWDEWNMASSATSGQDNAFTNFFNDENNAAVTNLMIQGYDGMTIKQPSGETYTIVFNREALQVVAN